VFRSASAATRSIGTSASVFVWWLSPAGALEICFLTAKRAFCFPPAVRRENLEKSPHSSDKRLPCQSLSEEVLSTCLPVYLSTFLPPKS
jgi:hypothetical protein